MMQKIFHYASPQNFYPLAGKLWPLFAMLGVVLSAWGLWLGMFVAPADFQQGLLGSGDRRIVCEELLAAIRYPVYWLCWYERTNTDT